MNLIASHFLYSGVSKLHDTLMELHLCECGIGPIPMRVRHASLKHS